MNDHRLLETGNSKISGAPISNFQFRIRLALLALLAPILLSLTPIATAQSAPAAVPDVQNAMEPMMVPASCSEQGTDQSSQQAQAYAQLLTLDSQPSTLSSGATCSMANNDSGDDPLLTMFRHPVSDRIWISGQMNIITQAHPAFYAKYSGPNSLQPQAQIATSRLFTLYTGAQLGDGFQGLLDIESAGGHGLSGGVGLGGFTDLDIVRTPNLGQAPYLARFLVEKTISLGGGSIESGRSYLTLAPSLPARRLELWLGKFSMVDFFDVNPVGSDSHLQFMNWAVDNDAAYDYAANTRGYTWGGVVEYYDSNWAVRFGEGMMPKVANGENLDADLARAHSENLEFEFHPTLFPKHETALRLLSFVNHADMGNYREAIDEFLSGQTPAPNIIATRRQGRVKYGFDVNAFQDMGHGLRLFGRWGWNNGRTESFAYTEVDRTVSGGGDLRGEHWRRRFDKVGAAFAIDEISGDHRRYLALGGTGFMLGDGALNYGLEQIVEGYYTFHMWRGLFGAVDFQHITNPGYNRDRGPVIVPSLRLHVDF
jgi:high affinity Mn2+ porin